jgi:site-specific DNA-methyltransferase (adenine-specific)
MKKALIKKSGDIEYSSFRLHKNGLEPIGNPSFEQWEEAGKFIRKAEGAVHFWIGDWLNYGEQKYGETFSQAIDETNYDYGTLRNDKSVASRVELSRRRDNLSWSHHAEVASLKPEDQDKLLEKAVKEELTSKDLRKLVGEKKKLPAPALPQGKYNVIYADPPWQYSNSGISGAAENHYPTMSIEELSKLEIPSSDNSVLFLWVTNPILFEAMPLIASWGFEYKTNMVWVKDIAGQGFYVKGQHELLLICVKGSMRPLDSLYVRSVVSMPRQKHSQKPTKFYEIIEELYPKGKYLELFARNKRDGWTSWGNDV